jgi:putative thioredoxin
MSELSNVIEVTESSFQQQVIEKSAEIPVLVDFWADWCAPCKMQLPVLLKLAGEYPGQLQIAKINTEQERALAEQHAIRSLPTLRLYRHGEVVKEVLGAQPEAALRTLIDAYIERESDRRLQQAIELDAQGRRSEALQLMELAYREDPDNPRLPLKYARLCLDGNQLDRAGEIIQALPREIREASEAASLKALLEFSRSITDAPSAVELESTLDEDPKQSEPRYQLAARQVLAGDYDNALGNFMLLLKQDRNYRDGAAQRGLLTVFALLDQDDERIPGYRRQMFALLH